MRLTTLQSGFEDMTYVFAGHITPIIGQAQGLESRSPVVVEPLAIDFRGLPAQAKKPLFFTAEQLPFRLARYLPDQPDRKTV